MADSKDFEKITNKKCTEGKITYPPSSDIASSQKSLPLSEDSGWNDPPKWALSPQRASSEISTKRLLNKRVAFPLCSQALTSDQASPVSLLNMPPISQSSVIITTAPHKPLVTPIGNNYEAKVPESDFDKDQVLSEVLANLESVMTDQEMEKNRIEEIQKKLVTMKSDWLDGKLDDTIQHCILDISKALLRKDIAQADEIHVTLMIQHANICRAWIPAIRYIILQLKKECVRHDGLQSEHQ